MPATVNQYPSVQQPPRRGWMLLLLLALAIISFGIGLTHGSYDIGITELLKLFMHPSESSPASMILYELRLPRIASAFVVGAMLALAGTVMQVLLRNPLADPYVLGISGGAGTAALLLLWLGIGGIAITTGAFVGAMISMLLIVLLAHGKGPWSSNRMLLTGVVLASGWGAMISFILSVAPDQQLRGMLFWLMGDLQYARVPAWMFIALLICLIWTWSWSRSLNILAIGQLQAKTLGITVEKLQWQFFFIASLLTSLAVMQAGSIGFVGLIIPHVLRLAGLTDHRLLLPASVLAGGSLLILADTLARSLYSEITLPVGVFMAMLGVPVFLWLLHRQIKSAS